MKLKSIFQADTISVAVALTALSAFANAASVDGTSSGTTFYRRPAMFSTRPDAQTKYVQSIDRFGPVGIGIELHPPAFVMKVKNVEPGSPAASTGMLRAGQIIESINREVLREIDPRIQLGNIITAAEATDGLVKLMIKENDESPPREIVVRIPVLGAYSETWPMNCSKSDRIVRNLADNIAAADWSGRIDMNGSKMLFLLSTGEEKDLEVVRGWMQKTVAANQVYAENGLPYQWFVSWGGPALAEYYLRTGDESALPVMQAVADAVRKTMYHDGWGGRGLAGHHMGLAGTGTLTFLLLARQCGVEVEEQMLQRALIHYFRFAGRGTNPYMDARPEQTFTDNGRNARLAYAMAAASALLPDGEATVYAKARDICAMKSFYSSSYMLHGHTGGGIGEVWRGAGMALVSDKEPEHYREFMNNRKWWYDISRRYDGSFGVLGGGPGYDGKGVSWVGPGMGLSYTAPRKKLCIFGAPRSRFAKRYNIPERPWGNAADDLFYSLEPAPDENGKVADLSGETVANDSGLPLHRAMADPTLSDDFILRYARHPEQQFRQAAAGAIVMHERFHLLPQLLKDKDPRVRQAGIMAIKLPHRRGTGLLDPGISEEHFTKEVRTALFDIINNPDESWYVVDGSLAAVSMAPAEEIAPHIDRLGYWLARDEWWLREAALKPLIVVAGDERYYKRVLPLLADALPHTIRAGAIRPLVAYGDPLKEASPEVQSAICDMLGEVYMRYPGRNANPPGGLHPTVSEPAMLKTLASAMAQLEGGKTKLYEVARKRMPASALPHQDIFLAESDLSAYSTELKTALNTIIVEQLIPQYIGRNWQKLKAFAASTGKGGDREMRELQGLYLRAGVDDYNWEVHGPKRNEMEWHYFSFDPPEKWTAKDDRMGRFRDVTFPDGVEDWFVETFNPVEAGWKRGLAPFGSADGRKGHPAATKSTHGCNQPFCGCGEPINTLWKKDVLLLRGTFNFPAFEEGYAYRLLHGGISHVGSGGGYRVYVNGKLFIDQKTGVDRRGGGVAIGRDIPRSWWPEFSGRDVNLSVITFMKHHPRTKAYGGNIMISMERMKCPSLPPEMLHKSAAAIPMTCTAWQDLQDPAKTNTDPEEGKFHYEGKHIPNAEIAGSWQGIGQVGRIEDFVPGDSAVLQTRRTPYRQIVFKEGGNTDNDLQIWSGDVLMNIKKSEALKVVVKAIADNDYLFIEAGGFDAEHPAEWQSPWAVFKRR